MLSTLARRVLLTVLTALVLGPAPVAGQPPAGRRFTPEDMFRVRRIGATAWSPDGRYVAIEVSGPGQWLDAVPTSDLSLIDVRRAVMRPLSRRSPQHVGFFNALWSPGGRRLAFLSIDTRAVVQLWTWAAGAEAPVAVAGIEPYTGTVDPPLAWIDDDRLAINAWDLGAERRSSLHARIRRGHRLAEGRQRAVAGRASASVLESRGGAEAAVPSGRLLILDLRNGARRTLARGGIHRIAVSADRCCITYLRRSAGRPDGPIASYLAAADGANGAEDGYSAVNWGTDRRAVALSTGREVPVPPPAPRPAAGKPQAPLVPPRPDARRVSASPAADAALFLADGADGSRLWLAGGGGRPLSSAAEIWRANEWMREVTLGRAESFTYTTADGRALTAWVLLPPGYRAGDRVGVVTDVYPGSMQGASVPPSFSAYQSNFRHPQLFAALGYAVLLPSMPAPTDPADSHALPPLLEGVIPAVDAAIARGFADANRIAVAGQSDGGFTVLGLITQTTRFRSAIASASFSNLASLYGTLYGQYRDGDAGNPESAQVLRMLQMERGVMGLGGPPWSQPERYRTHSAIWRADKVETPLMLIHGDLDFIPIQQAEEFFTALLRQDKRAMLLRYAGEGHTITARANVLDMWSRMAAWLRETLTVTH